MEFKVGDIVRYEGFTNPDFNGYGRIVDITDSWNYKIKFWHKSEPVTIWKRSELGLHLANDLTKLEKLVYNV